MKNDAQETSTGKFDVQVVEPIPFDPIAETKFITSNDFCKLVSELFRNVFADFEGCIFEPNPDPNNRIQPTISLIFNHGKYDEGARLACERLGDKVTGMTVLDRSRSRDHRLSDGDRYYLTQDASEFIKTLLIPVKYNKGEPNWKGIVADFVDGSTNGFYNINPVQQFTKVSFIDITRLCRLIFGSKDENGEEFDYGANIATAILPMMGYGQPVMSNTNYMLTITKALTSNVNKAYEDLGLATQRSYIIR